jgi:hypothetical protein
MARPRELEHEYWLLGRFYTEPLKSCDNIPSRGGAAWRRCLMLSNWIWHY